MFGLAADMPSATMATSGVLPPLGAFRRVVLPDTEVTDGSNNPDINSAQTRQRANELINTFHSHAHGFREYTRNTVERLTSKEPMSRAELYEVIDAHDALVDKFEAVLPRLEQISYLLPPGMVQEQLDFTMPKWPEAFFLLEEANDTVDTLNGPTHLQRLRDQTPDQMRIIRDYQKLRGRLANKWLDRTTRAILENSGLPQTELEQRTTLIYDQWNAARDAFSVKHEEVKAQLKESLQLDISKMAPVMRDIFEAERKAAEHVQFMFNLAFPEREVVEDDAEVRFWSDREFDELWKKLPSRKVIYLDVAQLKRKKDLNHEETQLLDNICNICFNEYEDPTRVGSACGHIFCFEHIVQVRTDFRCAVELLTCANSFSSGSITTATAPSAVRRPRWTT